MLSGTARNADLFVAVQNGDLAATHELGMRLRLGLGVDVQPEAAAALLQVAARRGYAEAQFELGLMHAGGEGVTEDRERAAYWIRRAAQQGIGRAVYWLACLYFHGEGVPRDLEQAYRLALSARLSGFSDAGGIMAAAAQYISPKRCAEIAEELGAEPM